MRILSEQQARLEIEIHDRMYVGFEDQETRHTGPSGDHFHNVPHECDECGEATTDVDLWAENTETGEELWLCMACGDL